MKKYTKEELEALSAKFDTPVKRYSKSELARLYNRTFATLRSWIYNNKVLMEELEKNGYRKSSKEFRKEHIILIFAYIGEP